MVRVHELIEAGQPPRENERALVVLDEAAEAELELSFYDYQQSRFVAPQGLTRALAMSASGRRREVRQYPQPRLAHAPYLRVLA